MIKLQGSIQLFATHPVRNSWREEGKEKTPPRAVSMTANLMEMQLLSHGTALIRYQTFRFNCTRSALSSLACEVVIRA